MDKVERKDNLDLKVRCNLMRTKTKGKHNHIINPDPDPDHDAQVAS